jgi:hypothetical protein
MALHSHRNFYAPVKALSEAEMRAKAPSIFAETAHSSRSVRFVAIPTINVIRRLIAEGFVVTSVSQGHPRDESREDFTKHLVRLEYQGDGSKYRVGDVVYQVVLKNGNDGTSAYDVMGGLERIVCLNGMVASEATLPSIKVKHSGDLARNVIDASFQVVGGAEKVLARREAWLQIPLSQDERMAYAESAHELRFPRDEQGNTSTLVKPQQLLAVRRFEDDRKDLWHTMNAVQENVIRGGVRGDGTRVVNGRARHVSRTTRAVRGVDQDVKLNRALWSLTEKMEQIKTGKPAAGPDMIDGEFEVIS